MRVLLVQDSTGHSTGYHVIARGLRDAGIEVILGGVLLPRHIVRLAGDEAADAIGYRIMDAAPALLVERLMEALREAEVDVPVAVGGIVPAAWRASSTRARR
jgi:methylmalonyl-CoA mutase C-terminal domain/subunit